VIFPVFFLVFFVFVDDLFLLFFLAFFRSCGKKPRGTHLSTLQQVFDLFFSLFPVFFAVFVFFWNSFRNSLKTGLAIAEKIS